MSRYDGLIIPRSYSEYINKTDAATLQQALQLPGVLSGAVAAGDNKAVTSNAVNGALAKLANYSKKVTLEENEIADLEKSFQKAADYSLFEGATQANHEFGWHGFKHTTNKTCFVSCWTAHFGCFAGKREPGSGWTFRQIIYW